MLYKATNISYPTISYDATVAYFGIQEQYLNGTRGNRQCVWTYNTTTVKLHVLHILAPYSHLRRPRWHSG